MAHNPKVVSSNLAPATTEKASAFALAFSRFGVRFGPLLGHRPLPPKWSGRGAGSGLFMTARSGELTVWRHEERAVTRRSWTGCWSVHEGDDAGLHDGVGP